MKKFGEWVARNRILVLVLAIILAIPSAICALRMAPNYDILSYLPSEVDSVQGQKILDESFGSSDSGILIFKGVKDFEIAKIEEKIEALEGVESVVWSRDILDVTVPEEMMPDELRDIFYQEDKDAVLLMINFNHSAANEITQNAVISIREIIHDEDAYLTGMSAIIRDVIDLSDSEKSIYIGLAVLITVVILGITLSSTVIPILFILGIGFGVLYNMGTNFFLSDVSYVTSAIAGVLQLGVTMDFSIFLYHRYEEEREKNPNHIEAMGIAIEKTAVAISGAALTTVAGFLALMAMKLTLGANIGVVMAKGVTLGVICTLTIMPALILVFDKAIHRFNHGTILPGFKHLSHFVVDKHIVLVIVALLLLVPAIYGSENKSVYYKLDDSLPRDMQSIVALNEMKDTFDMKSTYFAAVNSELPVTDIKTMISEMESVDGVNAVIGYQKFIGPMVPVTMIPSSIIQSFENEKFTKLSIISKYSAATEEANKQTEQLSAIIKSYDAKGVLTGEVPMMKDLIEVTDHDISVVNLLSVILLVIIIGVAFKSLIIPVILVITIELAVFINMGIPFYTRTSIPFIASIVIGSIQLGTTVDYAILLTTRFKEELAENSNKKIAMKIALQSSSKSIVTSGLTFFGSTFAVSAISNIDMISTLALMMGRGALISMVVIMCILPPLLLIFEKLISLTTIGWPRSVKEDLEIVLE